MQILAPLHWVWKVVEGESTAIVSSTRTVPRGARKATLPPVPSIPPSARKLPTTILPRPTSISMFPASLTVTGLTTGLVSMVPAVKFTLRLVKSPPLVSISALIVTPPFGADRFTLRGSLFERIELLIVMSLSALKLKVTSPPTKVSKKVFKMGADTVMFPCPPVPPAVVMKTLVPWLRVSEICWALILAVAPLGLKLGPGLAGLVGPPEIAISLGSSSQVPGRPWGARASTLAPEISSPNLPEVSTKPPSPPAGPPWAEMWP